MHVHCSPIRPYICGGGVRSLSPTWLCDPMDYRMPGSPVLHRLLEFAQIPSPPSSQWCYPHILSSAPSFSFCLATGSFLMSWLFASTDQSIGASASASVLPMNIQDWFPLGWTGLSSSQSRRLSRVFSNNTVQKHQFFSAQSSLWSNSHMTTGKTIAFTTRTFVGKVMSLLFNMLSRLLIPFLPRSKCLFHDYSHYPRWIWNSRKKKSATASTFYPSICHEMMG